MVALTLALAVTPLTARDIKKDYSTRSEALPRTKS